MPFRRKKINRERTSGALTGGVSPLRPHRQHWGGIGLRALSPGGRGVAFPSIEHHGVWAKLVSPHRRLAQTTETRVIRSI